MCGFTGICGRLRDEDSAWLDIACDRLRHRGPDAGGSWIAPEGNAALGHRRLTIIDTSHGSDQPFVSKDGKLILVYNGEIYNYLELRAQLEDEGVHFRTGGDTEVLLAAYRHWGEDCLLRLNGMWAFAIWDRRRGAGRERLFIARDRVGEKPMYYRWHSGRFEFASELKGLRTNGDVDLQALNHYLALGYVPGDLCLAARVHKLPPAHAGVFDMEQGNFRTWRYWQLPAPTRENTMNLSGEDLADQAWSLLTDSVRLRLRSDVPTGVFLSGGLDSSLVTAAAAWVSSQPIKTFTLGVPGSELDETAHAQRIAVAFDTQHHILPIDAPSLDVIDMLAPYIDEPIADSSILPSFLVSRMSAQYVTVALGGDGGDELYGGYRHYQNALRDEVSLGWLPRAVLQLGARLAATLPAGIYGRNRFSALRGGPAQSSIWGTPYFDIRLRRRLFTTDALAALGVDLDAPERRSLALYLQAQDPVDGLTRMDFQQVLPDDFLVKVDRTSMANSLEVRTPFLDYRLVEHAFSAIPPEWKCTAEERRRVQNLMARRYLPEGFEVNRKQGFSVPMDAWLRKADLFPYLECLQTELVKPQVIGDMIAGQRKGRSNGARLFALIMLGMTMRPIAK